MGIAILTKCGAMVGFALILHSGFHSGFHSVQRCTVPFTLVMFIGNELGSMMVMLARSKVVSRKVALSAVSTSMSSSVAVDGLGASLPISCRPPTPPV